MRSVSLIRCLTKMSPSSSTSTGSQIATWRRSFTTSATISDHCWRERCSSDHRRFSLNPVQHDILPHHQSQLSDLTIRLILRLLWSLCHKNCDFVTDFFEVYITKTVTLSPDVQIVLWPVYLSGGKSRDLSLFILIGPLSFSWRIPLRWP